MGIIDFLAEKEILIILSIGALIALICLFVFIQRTYAKLREKSKLKQNTQELNNLVRQVQQEMKKEQPVKPTVSKVEEQEKKPTKVEETTVATPKKAVATLSSVPATEKKKTPEVPIKKVEPKQAAVVDVQVEASKNEAPKAEKTTTKPVEKKSKPKQEEIIYKDEVYTQTEAQQELERITKELVKEEDNKIELTAFEAQQEDNAIISLQELFAKGRQLIQEDENGLKDEGNEPISLEDLEKQKQMQLAKEETQKQAPVEMVPQEVAIPPRKQVKMEEFTKPQEAYSQGIRKYTPSPVISPVYGIENAQEYAHEESLQLENTANFEKLDEEIRKTNEFLAILKELQKKLD